MRGRPPAPAHKGEGGPAHLPKCVVSFNRAASSVFLEPCLSTFYARLLRCSHGDEFLDCDGVHGANSVFTPRGTFSQKEILVWKNGQTICAGVAISFLRLSYVNRDSRFLVVAEPLVHLGGDTFASRGVPPVLINLELVRAHVSYQKVQGGLRLNLPRAW